MACSAVRIASPVAVRRGQLQVVDALRRPAGGRWSARPARWPSPRRRSGPGSARRAARRRTAWRPTCAAFSRVGVTSVASMDSDTSMASMTVARLRGTLLLRGRTGQRDGEQQHADQQQRGGWVPPPARLLRRDLLQQLQVGEAQVCGACAALHDQVADGQRGARRRAAGTTRRASESGQAQRLIQAPPDQRRLRATTNRTMSAIQSESVRSSRCAPPACRSAAATWRGVGRRGGELAAQQRGRRSPRAAGRSPGRRGSPGRPRAGRARAGSRTSTPSRSCRADSARSGRSHVRAGRGSRR